MGGALRVAILLGLLAALTAPAAQAAFPGQNGRIAFNSNRDGDMEIYTMAPDATDLQRLTHANGLDYGPAWSADGRRIAFTSNRDGNGEVYVIGGDGSSETRLTDSPGEDIDPSWSPDGQHIVFASNRAGSYDLYTMNPDGSDQTRITSAPGNELNPEWSPDGARIAFSSHDGLGGGGLLTMTPAGSDVRQLTAGERVVGLDWSPDGSRIVLGTGDIATVSATDGNDRQTVVTDPDPFVNQVDPAWAPAGDLIAYHAFACELRGCFSPDFLEIVNPDGTGRTTVLSDGADNAEPDWQPLVGPSREDFKNASKYCRALLEFLGYRAFFDRYRSYGRCIRQNRRRGQRR